MSKAIEGTLKALNEFESQLDSAGAEASEAKRQMIKKAAEWAEAAKEAAIAEAYRLASDVVSRARKEAEKEADSMAKKGQVALKRSKEIMSDRRFRASQMVARMLLGEES